MEASCFLNRIYNCAKSKEKLQTNGVDRIKKIIEYSHEYGDGIGIELSELLSRNGDLKIKNHKSCVSKYTSSTTLNRVKRKSDNVEDNPKLTKTLKRSSTISFNFMKNCLFCGDVCVVEKDARHPDRWRKAFVCRTIKHFKDAILETCNERNDEISQEVKLRLDGAISDLHAAEARYHDDCRKRFMLPSEVSQVNMQTVVKEVDAAYEFVVNELKSDKIRTWNTTELYRLYIDNNGVLMSRRELLLRLKETFSDEISIFSSPGVASIVMFSHHAKSLLRTVEDDDVDEVDLLIRKLTKVIKSEVNAINIDNKYYDLEVSREMAGKYISDSFWKLLDQLLPPSQKLVSIQIGNMLTGAMKRNPTPLQTCLGLLIKENKHLLNKFSQFGVTCTHDEGLRFRKSAAIAGVKNANLSGISDAKHGLIQSVADNFDADISSPNGKLSTHSLAILLTQPDKNSSSISSNTEKIKRVPKSEMTQPIDFEIKMRHYQGPKNVKMPIRKLKSLKELALQKLKESVTNNSSNDTVPSLKQLAIHNICNIKSPPSLKQLTLQHLTAISKNKAEKTLVSFFRDICGSEGCPEFNGYCTKLAREDGCIIQPKTKAVYLPLVDSTPSDPDTILTAMDKVKQITEKHGQKYTIMTLDQQLYRVAVGIQWAYTEEFVNFITRLGGMHMLMSFMGSIGTLLQGTGFTEILSSTFGSVNKMLIGKKFPQNVRAFRMVAEEILRGLFENNEIYTPEDLENVLESISLKSVNAKLWIDCLVRPTFISMMFVKAEREGDWLLHLQMVREMMPYFFAANHIHYARYGLYYLRCMERLPNELLGAFMQGQHTMHHNAGVWNGIWSDMFIETTFMRYGHGPKGIIGITLKPETLKTWALGLHICSKVDESLETMVTEDKKKKVQITHKEEMISRIKQDREDRESIRKKLDITIDPFDVSQNYEKLVNIATGKVADVSVNVHDAVNIGKKQMIAFEGGWPESFNQVIKKMVKTMGESKKHIKHGDQKIFDTAVIFSRLIGLQATCRSVNIDEALKYELAPLPTSMFEDSGQMRDSGAKSALKSAMAIKTSHRLLELDPTSMRTLVLDGCAIFYCVHWPSKGNVSDYIENFKKYLGDKLDKDVFLIFDRYYEYSTKDATRNGRKQASRIYQLNSNMPLPPREAVLTVSENKKQLIQLIIQSLLSDKQFIERNRFRSRLFVTGQDLSPIEISNGSVLTRNDMSLSHEEGDTMIIQQAFTFANINEGVGIIANDTDVFILLAYFYNRLNCTFPMYMISTTDESEVIDIRLTVSTHKEIIPNVLGAHSITGCDTVARYNTIGKKTVFNVLKSGYELDLLGDISKDFTSIISQATKFVSGCYQKGCSETDMTCTRIRMWKKRFAKSKATAKFLSTLPPTTEAFMQNVLRAHFQTYIWKQSLQRHPDKLNPLEYGFRTEHSTKTLEPIMLPENVLLAPESLLKLIRCTCAQEESCKTTQCGCFKSRLKCTQYCNCENDSIHCQNHV